MTQAGQIQFTGLGAGVSDFFFTMNRNLKIFIWGRQRVGGRGGKRARV